jgi:hypothetical protein
VKAFLSSGVAAKYSEIESGTCENVCTTETRLRDLLVSECNTLRHEFEESDNHEKTDLGGLRFRLNPCLQI